MATRKRRKTSRGRQQRSSNNTFGQDYRKHSWVDTPEGIILKRNIFYENLDDLQRANRLRKSKSRIDSGFPVPVKKSKVKSLPAGMGPGKGAQPPRPGRRRLAPNQRYYCDALRERLRREFLSFLGTPPGAQSKLMRAMRPDYVKNKKKHDDRFTGC